jgi:hypothetical protein
MKRVLLSAALGIVLLGVGAGGMYYWDLRQTPAPIRSACRLVNDAYTDANRLAEAENRRNISGGMVSVASMYWNAADQAKLDDAARTIEDAGGYGRFPAEWQNVVIQISGADHDLAMQLSGNGPTAPDPLMLVQAACAGR